MITTNKLFETKSEMVEYLLEHIDEKFRFTALVDLETAIIIAESVDGDDYENYQINIDNTVDTYYIEQDGLTWFTIKSAYTSAEYDGEDVFISFEDEEILIMDDVMNDDLMKNIRAFDELVFLSYEEDDMENSELETCEECAECEFQDEIDDFLEEKFSEFIENLKANEDNENFCFHCAVKEILEQVYATAYEDGRNSLCLGLSDLLLDIAEEKI